MITEEVRKKFFFETEHSGRFVVHSFRTGKKYYVEPIEGKTVKWGDLNPATGQVEGNYGSKYRGGIKAKDSLITEENGFSNIQLLPPGHSPAAMIEELDSKYPTINGG